MEEEVRTWWVIRGKEKSGPYVRSELKAMAASGQLFGTDHIWKEGLKTPLLAASMNGLEFAAPAPAPEVTISAAATAAPGAQSSSWTVSAPPAPQYEPYVAPLTDVREEEALTDEYGFAFDPLHVPANHGVNWIATGWRIFWSAPLLWGLTMLILASPKFIAHHHFGSDSDSSSVQMAPADRFYHPPLPPADQASAPLLSGTTMMVLVIMGIVLIIMLGPVINAGLYALAHAIHEDNSPGVGHVFHGFTRRLGSLMLLGLMLLVCVLGSAVLAACGVALFASDSQLHLGTALLQLLTQPSLLFGMLMGTYISHPLLALGIFLIFSVLMGGSFWFATPLVFFQGMNPLAAMQASLKACLRNFMGLLVYVLLLADMYMALASLQVIIVVELESHDLTTLATIVSFVLTAISMSILAATGYASFRDIFGKDD